MKNQNSLIGKISLSIFALLWTTNVCFALQGGVTNNAIKIAPHLEKDAAFLRNWITYKAPAGSVINDAVDVENLTNDIVSFDLRSIDAEQSSEKGFALTSSDNKQIAIGQWINLKEAVSLEPHQIKTVNFTINVPKDAGTMDYWGGITVQETESSLELRDKHDVQMKDGTPYKVRSRLGIRTMVRVTSGQGAKIERLLIGASPRDELATQKQWTIFNKIYLAVVLSYFILLVWLIISKINRKNNLSVILKKFWAHLLILIIFVGGIFAVTPIGFNQNELLTSVLNGATKGFSIAPAKTVDEAGKASNGSWFILKGKSGDVVSGKAVIKNNGSETAYIVVSSVDATVTNTGALPWRQIRIKN